MKHKAKPTDPSLAIAAELAVASTVFMHPLV